MAVATLDNAQRHQQAGEWGAAGSDYEALAEQQPDNPAVWFGLAYCLPPIRGISPSETARENPAPSNSSDVFTTSHGSS